ncbi:MAG: putative ABC exporter domain-containing protein [Planctomycetes bacterium]|nr:putative ABC exporter domain-containing protein [Planctomycetota bacterium]
MHSALFYLAVRQSAGSLKYRLSRLKNPRYSLPAVLAIVYFWLSFGMPGLMPARESTRDADYAGMIRLFVGPGIGMLFLMGWLVATGRPAPAFTRPEAGQLFVLPLSRRDLVRYRLLRPQLVFVVLGCFAALGSLRSDSISPLFAFCGAFVILNLLAMNSMLAALVLNRMKRARLPSLVMYLPAMLIVAWVVVPVALNYSAPLEYDGTLREWISNLLSGGVAGIAHWPFQLLGGIALATDLARFGMALGAGAVWAVVLYIGCMVMVAPFEEGALELAETTGRKVDAMRKGGALAASASRLKSARTSRLGLKPTGPAWRAIFWQTLVADWRVGPWRIGLIFAAVIAVAGVFADRISGNTALQTMIIGLSGAGVILLVMMGPRMLATGLHTELRRLPLLKSLPITGYGLLRGKSWAGGLLVFGPGVLLMTGAFAGASDLVNYKEFPYVVGALGAGLALLLPTAATMIALEASAVLMFPAWMTTAQSEPGFEQIGRNLLSLLVRMVLGSFMLIIPGGLFAVGVAIGVVTDAIAPALAISGLLAAIAMTAQLELLMWLMGKRYDRMDGSPE